MKRLVLALLTVAFCQNTQAQIGVAMVGTPNNIGTDSVSIQESLGEASLAVGDCMASCYVPLAVTGLELKGNRKNAAEVYLQWQTLSESNNKGFYIERSLSNTSNFQQVGFVTGAGNSVQKLKYNLTDYNSFDGTSYYRLQQMDNDGRYVYSNIVDVKGIAQNKLSIRPNPAKNYCTLVFNQSVAGKKLLVNIFDAAGRIVMQRSFSNNNSGIITIEQLPELPPGVYVVSVLAGQTKYFGKLTITK